MKKTLVTFILTICMALSVCGCSSGGDKKKDNSVTSTETFSLDAICVDDSYRDKDNSPLRMVYLFYTLTAKDENMEIDSTFTELTINDANTYKAEHFVTGEPLNNMPSYYYSSYIEDVYTGTSLKVAATFEIPETDLAAGKTITLKDDQIPGLEAIKFSTDDIKHYSDINKMAKEIDPEGYKKMEELKSDADEVTVQKVKDAINGYEWSFYVNYTSYTLAFIAENEFNLRTSLGTSSNGTYEVKKGYIFCKYPNMEDIIEIPYTFENGNIKLDAASAFDVNE